MRDRVWDSFHALVGYQVAGGGVSFYELVSQKGRVAKFLKEGREMKAKPRVFFVALVLALAGFISACASSSQTAATPSPQIASTQTALPQPTTTAPPATATPSPVWKIGAPYEGTWKASMQGGSREFSITIQEIAGSKAKLVYRWGPGETGSTQKDPGEREVVGDLLTGKTIVFKVDDAYRSKITLTVGDSGPQAKWEGPQWGPFYADFKRP
jgi:hypothetical protein